MIFQHKLKFNIQPVFQSMIIRRLTNHWKNPSREMVDITKDVDLNLSTKKILLMNLTASL